MADEPRPKAKSGYRVPHLTHQATAYAQIVLSGMFAIGYFTLLYEFAHGHVQVPPQLEDAFKMLLVFLTANLGTIISFWFQRQRVSMDPPK
jgi:hypothetical protein